MDMERLFDRLVSVLALSLPPLFCLWGWWAWGKQASSISISRWRRISAGFALVLVSASILLGDFALFYWRLYPGDSPGPPGLTRVTTFLGLDLAILGVVGAVFAKSQTRIATLLCSFTLLGFFFLMILSP